VWSDVSNERKGWDIEAWDTESLLRIEVKGSASPVFGMVAELTPNEFTKMRRHRGSFRLAMVSVAKSRVRGVLMFAWNSARRVWMAGGGRYRIQLHRVTGASATIIASGSGK
jgi:hypothetical protein